MGTATNVPYPDAMPAADAEEQEIMERRNMLEGLYEQACTAANHCAREAERQMALARSAWAGLRELNVRDPVPEFAPHREDEHEASRAYPPQTMSEVLR